MAYTHILVGKAKPANGSRIIMLRDSPIQKIVHDGVSIQAAGTWAATADVTVAKDAALGKLLIVNTDQAIEMALVPAGASPDSVVSLPLIPPTGGIGSVVVALHDTTSVYVRLL